MTDLLMPIPEGSTRLFAVLGDPVEQVMAPVLMNRLFRDSGVDAVLVPMHIRPEELPEAMAGLRKIRNLDGILVTIPHKFAVCNFMDHLSTAVQLTGAANALRRESDGSWSAENFDGRGFVAGLHNRGHQTASKHVALVGTGGAGVAIAAALVESGVASLAVMDLSPEKAEALVARLEKDHPGIAHYASAIAWPTIDIAINATPMGLRPDDPVPFEVDELRAGALVADVIMKPHETKLLTVASAHGHHTHHGIHMLTSQIDLYRQFFRVGSAATASAAY